MSESGLVLPEQKAEALIHMQSMLNMAICNLAREVGRKDVLDAIEASGIQLDSTVKEHTEAMSKTLNMINLVGLAISAVADGDDERLNYLAGLLPDV